MLYLSDNHPLVDMLTQHDAINCRRQTFPSGTVLLSAAAGAGEHIGVIRQGLVKMSVVSADGRERILSFLGRGSVFGEVTALAGGRVPRCLQTSAVTPTEVWLFSRQELLQLLTEHPPLMQMLIRSVAVKEAALINQVTCAAFETTEGLVTEVLLHLSERGSSVVTTHEQIAAMIGRNRVTVSQALKRLRTQGAIVQRKGRIIVRDRDNLVRYLRRPEGFFEPGWPRGLP